MALKLTDNIRAEDKEKIAQLNQEAFIEEQRMPFDKMQRIVTAPEIQLLAIYNEDSFVGFFLTAANEQTAYIFFFAIDAQFRSKGYGSKALALLSDFYPNRQIVLDLEKVDIDAPNNPQRISRKNFYLRNGFHETGFQFAYDGMSFEILCTEDVFDKDGFSGLLNQITPVLNTIRKEPLHASILPLN